MGCLQLPLFARRVARSKSTSKPAPASDAKVAEKKAAKRVSLPQIGTLPFERKKRDTREIAKRDSGKSGLSDVTFVDDDENKKRSSRLSTSIFKISLDFKKKDELADGLRYRGPSVKRRDTLDTLDSPLSPSTLAPDSPEEERIPKWKEEGLDEPEKKKAVPEAESAEKQEKLDDSATKKEVDVDDATVKKVSADDTTLKKVVSVDGATLKEVSVEDAALKKEVSIDDAALKKEVSVDDAALKKEITIDNGALKKEVKIDAESLVKELDLDDPEQKRIAEEAEAARKKLEKEEQEHRDFLQML